MPPGRSPIRRLDQAQLRWALLSRQLLLERSPLQIGPALERVAGLQTQYAPSAYIGLWSRLAGFQRHDLTGALERRVAIQATLMRMTIHTVSRRDFWPMALGIRRARREWWLRLHPGLEENQVAEAAGRLRSALGGGTIKAQQLATLLEGEPREAGVGEAAGVGLAGGVGLAAGVGLWLDLVRVPPSGTWERRRADIYAAAEDWQGPPSGTEDGGVETLVRRYLGGFGPARVGDVANWAGLGLGQVSAAIERIPHRTFLGPEGSPLIDLPRAPLPHPDMPAPPRFLGTWEALLLAHARRTGVLPERFRPLIFHTKAPHSFPTFLVDGEVAGRWRAERTGERASLLIDPFEPLTRVQYRDLCGEAEGMIRFLEPTATIYRVGRANSE